MNNPELLLPVPAVLAFYVLRVAIEFGVQIVEVSLVRSLKKRNPDFSSKYSIEEVR